MKLLESARRGEEVVWEIEESVETIQTFTFKVVQLLLKRKGMGLLLSVSGGRVGGNSSEQDQF